MWYIYGDFNRLGDLMVSSGQQFKNLHSKCIYFCLNKAFDFFVDTNCMNILTAASVNSMNQIKSSFCYKHIKDSQLQTAKKKKKNRFFINYVTSIKFKR